MAAPRCWCFPRAAAGFTSTKTWDWSRHCATRSSGVNCSCTVWIASTKKAFYCFWSQPWDRVHRHIRYEDYLLNEVLPLMWAKNGHPCVIAHGCSFGAFHAVNFAFRHPQAFRKVVALSGRYDLTLSVEHFRNLFDGHYDEHVYFNTPAISSRISPIRMFWTICGSWRSCWQLAITIRSWTIIRNLSESLWHKGVWHACTSGRGGRTARNIGGRWWNCTFEFRYLDGSPSVCAFALDPGV
jgi:pimeloyl-ACP methyl ester carboxylesterase